MPAVPWPDNPAAVLTLGDDGDGWITFIDPEVKRRTSLPVTTGPSHNSGHKFVGPDGQSASGPIWHVSVFDDTLVTSPSIRVQKQDPDTGQLYEVYHSPARVVWRRVNNNELEERS